MLERPDLLSNSHRVRQGLERVMPRGFEIKDRHIAVLGEASHYRISHLGCVVFHLWKRPHADRGNVTRQDTRGFFDVLGFVGVHHDTFAMLQTPRAFAHVERDGITSELIDGYLHRRASAKRGIEKHKRYRFAG